jgi:hypothetical protein
MKSLDAYLRQLRAAGYEVDKTHGNHWRISSGARRVATVGSTPSSSSSLMNLKSHIKRWERQTKGLPLMSKFLTASIWPHSAGHAA